MQKTNDPKYGINNNGKICNLETSVAIPDDEPIFILRAQDMLALQVLIFYKTTVATEEHKDAVRHRIREFRNFGNDNPGRMKAPDTRYPFPKIEQQASSD